MPILPGEWRAGVIHENPFSRSLTFALGQVTGMGARSVTGLTRDGLTFEDTPEAALPSTLSMPEDAARALHDALSRHFGGTGDTRQLRRDYDAERARVDQLTTTLTTLVLKER